MRPFVFLSLFSAATLVAADHTELIDNQDNRITYSDGWKYRFIAGGGTLSVNDKDSGTASLTVYNTSRIAVRVFVEVSGQVVRISLDNLNHDITPLPDQPAWTSDALDPSVPHNIDIIKQSPGGQYLELESILMTLTDGNSPTTTREDTTEAVPASTIVNAARKTLTITATKTSSTSTETETPTKRPEGQSGLTTTTKVGIAVGLVGAVCLGLLGALGVYIRRKRDTHGATLHPFSRLDEGGTHVFQSTGALSTRTEGISREHGVKTEPDRGRKAGSPNGGIHPAPGEGGDTAAFPLESAAPPRPPTRSPSDNLSAPPPYTP